MILKVPGDMDGFSAQIFLQRYIGQMSGVDRLFKEGKVRTLPLGRKLDPRTPLSRGARVLVFTDNSRSIHEQTVEVSYEDEEFIVFNKPQGMPCIGKAEKGINLYYHAVERMKNQGEYDVASLHVPYVCNVLPAFIGGLVIVVKEQFLFEYMLEALRERRIKRVYRVIVTGEPKQSALLHGFMEQGGTFSKAVLQDKMNRNARPAALRYRLIERHGELSLLEVEPMSCYKQQIPLQLAKAGLPMLGDKAFGSSKANHKFGIDRPAIWMYKIVFETGHNNYLEYLNGKEICAETIYMPGFGYFMDQKEPKSVRIEFLNKKQIKQATKLAQNSFMQTIARGEEKSDVLAFRERVKPSMLCRAIEQGEMAIWGCFGPEGMDGMLALADQTRIELLFVKPDCFNKGIGRALLKQAEEYCLQHGKNELIVDTPISAAPFYQKCGFIAQKEIQQDDDIRNIRMIKQC